MNHYIVRLNICIQNFIELKDDNVPFWGGFSPELMGINENYSQENYFTELFKKQSFC